MPPRQGVLAVDDDHLGVVPHGHAVQEGPYANVRIVFQILPDVLGRHEACRHRRPRRRSARPEGRHAIDDDLGVGNQERLAADPVGDVDRDVVRVPDAHPEVNRLLRLRDPLLEHRKEDGAVEEQPDRALVAVGAHHRVELRLEGRQIHARALGHEGHDLRRRPAPRPEHHGSRLNDEVEEPAHVRDGVLDQREKLSLDEAGPDQVPGRARRGLFERDFRGARPGRHDHDFLVEIEHGIDGSSSLARLAHDENQPLRIARLALGVGDDADQDAGELRQIDPPHDLRSGRRLSRQDGPGLALRVSIHHELPVRDRKEGALAGAREARADSPLRAGARETAGAK